MAEQKRTSTQGAVWNGSVPEWASPGAVAQLLGISVRRVQQLAQEGVLETALPPGGKVRKYRTCETVQRYTAYKEEKARETADRSRTAELSLKKLEAEVRLKESQSELAAIKADIAGGRYIETAAAAQELAQFMDAFKAFARNIPSRVAGIAASSTDAATARAIQRATGQELEDMLALFVSAALPGPGEGEDG